MNKHNTIYSCVILILGSLLSPGCREVDTYAPYKDKSLEIFPGNSSAAGNENSGFIPGDSLGVFLVLTESEQQIGPVTKYTRTSAGWFSDSPLKLSRDHYTAYAHAPYSGAVLNAGSVPMRFDLTDYMWARSGQTDISSQKVGATFSMQRLLARVSLTIVVKGEYEHPGLLSGIDAYNAADKSSMATDASQCSFDTRTGLVSIGTQPQGGSLPLLRPDGTPVQNLDLVLTSDKTTKIGDLLVIPFLFTDGEIAFRLTIDAKNYTLPIPSPSGHDTAANGGWNKGCHYSYTLTMNAVGHITIGSIGVNDWVEVTDDEPESTGNTIE